MKCISYCTADSYRVKELIKYLNENNFNPELYDDVVHIRIYNKAADDYPGDVFIFPIGCVIFWGVREEVRNQILDFIQLYEIDSFPLHAQDTATYIYNSGEKTHIHEEEDKINLETDDVLIKLSMSHAFAQSVKLIHFEDSVMETIKNSRYLTEELAKYGKTSLSRKQLSQKIGTLFVERNSINLHSDSLDTPEFFWRKPRYEPYYIMAAAYMDITTRLQILNRRLDVIHELYDILSEELKHLHSSRLELVIIYLIVIEVVLVLLKDFLQWV
jgi:uncharacterized Rmd1/YagE family protein